MPGVIEVRRARADEAAAAAGCLRRSITTLCVADHRNDPQALQRWLANKTAEQAAQWIASPAHCAQVARRDGTIVGVGLLDLASATIALLYVDPSARVQRRQRRAAARTRAGRMRRRPHRTGAHFHRHRGPVLPCTRLM